MQLLDLTETLKSTWYSDTSNANGASAPFAFSFLKNTKNKNYYGTH